MFLWAKSERVNVNTFIRIAGVGLVRLDPREVRTFTLREAVLAVKLELSGDDWVLTPTVHIQRGFSKDESSGIRDTRVINVRTSVVKKSSDGWVSSNRDRNRLTTNVDFIVRVGRTMPVTSEIL